MNFNDVVKMCHENAVLHGWWSEKKDLLEVLALIHSEWSEALEEARAGRPLVYKLGGMAEDEDGALVMRYVEPSSEEYATLTGKPEGIAVELIDGVIRILDAFGEYGVQLTRDGGRALEIEDFYGELAPEETPEELSHLVALLHMQTSACLLADEDSDEVDLDDVAAELGLAVAMALTWVSMQGLDPMEVLMEKHRYNQSRPWKHGKKF